MSRKKALITGVTGQDGAYLARLLLDKGYEVHGMKRRASSFNSHRVDGIYTDPHNGDTDFFMHYGDMTDSSNIMRLVQSIEPDEVYNLAAQSHVQVSFETAEYTANADAFGTLRILEAIRTLKLAEKTRFYQASTSELYGKVQEVPQSETTPFYPRSPYAVAKLYAFWICVNYREAYNHVCLQWHFVQSRKPHARRNFRDTENCYGCCGNRNRQAKNPVSGQSRRQARLGSCARICRGHVSNSATR